MTSIKATCPRCGEVDLTPDDIVLSVSTSGDGSTYSFECAGCNNRISKPADSRIVQLLISGGVKANMVKPERHVPADPPFTYDDLLDFHMMLENEDILDRFLRSLL
jgi:hypothetical protein